MMAGFQIFVVPRGGRWNSFTQLIIEKKKNSRYSLCSLLSFESIQADLVVPSMKPRLLGDGISIQNLQPGRRCFH